MSSTFPPEKFKNEITNGVDFAKTPNRMIRLSTTTYLTTNASRQIYIWLDIFGVGTTHQLVRRSGVNFTLPEYYEIIREYTGTFCKLQDAIESLEGVSTSKSFQNIGELYDMSLTPEQDMKLFDFSIEVHLSTLKTDDNSTLL